MGIWTPLLFFRSRYYHFPAVLGAKIHPVLQHFRLGCKLTKGGGLCDCLHCVPGNVGPCLVRPFILLVDLVSVGALTDLIANVVSVVVVSCCVTTGDYGGFNGGWP
jgi:hypothetical protein